MVISSNLTRPTSSSRADRFVLYSPPPFKRTPTISSSILHETDPRRRQSSEMTPLPIPLDLTSAPDESDSDLYDLFETDGISKEDLNLLNELAPDDQKLSQFTKTPTKKTAPGELNNASPFATY